MKLWIRKIFVVFMAVFTLGIYVPPMSPNADSAAQKDIATTSGDEERILDIAEIEQDKSIETDQTDVDYVSRLTEKAQTQTMLKLGPRIIPQIEGEFTETILPTIEKVITALVSEAEADAVPYYGITEQPASGEGERIFNVYDERTKESIAKFHVRRENRPLEGYWFNFHYHLSDDHFEKHYDIGEVYWDKNIPPKWMA